MLGSHPTQKSGLPLAFRATLKPGVVPGDLSGGGIHRVKNGVAVPAGSVPQGLPDAVRAVLAQHLQEAGDVLLFYLLEGP
jgi:hypothetical protein